jgi:hypothetical protein
LVAIDLVQSPFVLFNWSTAKQNVCTPREPDIFGDLSSLLKCFWSKVRDDSVKPLAQRTKNAYLTTIRPLAITLAVLVAKEPPYEPILGRRREPRRRFGPFVGLVKLHPIVAAFCSFVCPIRTFEYGMEALGI